MKVLFIGGTGIISSACTNLAIEKGIELYHLNRGISISKRNVTGVKQINADIRNFEETQKILKDYNFDAVVDWIAFTKEHIENDIKLFTGKTKQFIFISSASAYQTPPQHLPVSEKTPLENPYWQYSRNKIECENILMNAFKEKSFPVTIVRPSHTYDKTLLPLEGGYTIVDRMLKGKPVVVHGDGTSIWTLTHHKDFAVGLVGLLGKSKALGEAYHITSNELLTWNMIFDMVADAFGTTAQKVHITSQEIANFDSEIGSSLLGDKTHSMIFDNAKIKSIVPEFNPQILFAEGIKEIAEWYKKNPENCITDPKIDALIEKLVTYKSKQ
ncbi:MAG: NAD-dependent epimerase/dehydratase family protein [Bacteroidales bacterium]|nr:NAD-dependent epimerase/dehydratase family protein [Bacteroidales bacterium]